MSEAREIAEDEMEPGFRVLAEMIEHSARVRRLRLVDSETDQAEEGEHD